MSDEIIARLKTEQETIRLKLTSLRGELHAQVDADDLEDMAPDLLEHDMVLSRIRDLESQLELVEHALQRVAEGVYGICERCGQSIDPARLEAMPETTFCVNCKTSAGSRYKHN